MRVVDIGGNIGIYALTLAKRVKGGKVITFSPTLRTSRG